MVEAIVFGVIMCLILFAGKLREVLLGGNNSDEEEDT